MATRRLSGIAVSASEPDNGGDHSGGGSGGTYVDDVFSTYVYKGNGSTQTITNGIDLAGEGGLVWVKDRDGVGREHFLVDSERGIGKYLSTDSPNREATYNPANGITSFNPTGFDIGLPYGGNVNYSNTAYTSWTFRKQPGFFDVVTYTGDNSKDQAVPHNLGVEPGMIIIKNLSSNAWVVYHRGVGLGNHGRLDSTNQFLTQSGRFDKAHTSSEFYIGYDGSVNGNGEDYVAYLFAHDDSDESMIKCGSYTGTGVAGNFVDIGWEPQYVLIKNSTTGGTPWVIFDAIRGVVAGGIDNQLLANTSQVENGNFGPMDWLTFSATGFSLETNGSYVAVNSSGDTFVYMAIRRPNKPAEEFEPEELFAVNSRGADNPPPSYRSNFIVDAQIRRPNLASGGDTLVFDRLRGSTNALKTNAISVESPAGSTVTEQDQMEGIGSNDAVDANDLSWMWRRAPSFFDVVAYNSSGGWTTVSHNLAVEPEIIISKARSNADNWWVWVPSTGRDQMFLNTDGALPQVSGYIRNATKESFEILPSHTENIAYLFATVPGISKVGSYTGNGGNTNIDCGFTNGARFVLIKRTDEVGDWWFTVDPNNPAMLAKLNSADAASDQGVSIYAFAGGFGVSQRSSTNLCVGGAEYIFYAIA